MARSKPRDALWEPSLEALRSACMALPGVGESLTFGNPTFKVGKKAFAVLDSYGARTCIWFRCDPARRDALLGQPGMFAAPYDKAGAALCLEAQGIDWETFALLLADSHGLAILG